MPAAATRTAPAAEPSLAATPKPDSAKKDAALESDNIASSADVTAFLQMLPFNASCFDKDLDNDIRRDAYQSSSGNSSPQREEEEAAAPSAAAAGDLNFHVDDIEMWEVLEALDVPGPSTAAVNASLESPASFSSPTQSRSMTGVGPAKSAAQPSSAGKSGVGVKRSLPAAAAPAAAPAAVVKKEVSELGLKPLVSCPADEGGADVSDAEGGDGEGGDGEGDGSGDPLEQKRLKRMRRNRESAAMSRNRKKAYIEELEAKVAALKASVHQLQSENQTLKQDCSSTPASAVAAAAGAAAPGALQAAGSSSDALADDDLGLSLEQLGAVVGDDLCLGLPPLDIPSGHGDEDASALPGGKKVSTAALAMMSALTFVTLSANSSGPLWSRDAGHSPTSRVLMSLSDETARRFGRDEELPLWPAIDALAIDTLQQPPQAQALYESPEPIASALATALPTPLPPPVRPPASASASASASSHSSSHVRVEQVEGDAGKDAGRVLMLPRNSSWADALRVEAAEKQLMVRGEAAMLHGSGGGSGSGAMPPVPDTGALLASPLPLQIKAAAPADKVYEPAWEGSAEEEEEYFEPYDPHSIETEENQRRRFIFCARAYTFDVTSARRGARASSPAAPSAPAPAAPAPSRELSLPAMPARFRHGAARVHELPNKGLPNKGLPQLTDGHMPGGNESEPLPLPSARYPVVSMLLPSAALRGVVTGVDDGGSDDLSGDLMQVSCQVLNASRWGGA